jgi:hypothetical protein
MSSLQAFYSGAFSSSGLTTTLADVLLDGNTASTDILMNGNDVTGAGLVSAVTVTASGAVTGASMATQTLNASSNITTSGSVILTSSGSISNNSGALTLGTSPSSQCLVNGTIQSLNSTVTGALQVKGFPLQCDYPTFPGYSNVPVCVGYITGEPFVALALPLANTNTATLLYQSPVVVPLGVWMVTARVQFSSTDPPSTTPNIFFSCGTVQGEIPSINTQAGIRSNVGYVNFTSMFQSITGSQSPTFSYQCNAANCTADDISYKLIRIG